MPPEPPYKDRIQKFRANPRKSAEQEAARLRTNQRRHRERVKARTEELESRLTITQQKLEEALARIDSLTTEVRRLRSELKPSSPSPTPQLPPPSSLEAAPSQPGDVPPSQDPLVPAVSIEGRLEDNCALLPPPGPGESTMLCRDAYSIITQRLEDVDYDAVTEALKSGFRRAMAPGDGCRVQTHILFSFVDRII